MPRDKLTTTKVKIVILPFNGKSTGYSFRAYKDKSIILQTIEFLKSKL